MFTAETVTPASQAITFTVTAAFVTLMTLLIGNHNKRQTAEALRAQHVEDEQRRMAEKAADNVVTIAKEARDYARQDMIQERTDRTARRTLRELASVKRLGKVTHALVNSDKTAGMRRELDQKRTAILLTKEVMELKRANGLQPTPESLALLADLQREINSLGRNIEDRVAEQQVAEVANLAADQAAADADADDADGEGEGDDLAAGLASEPLVPAHAP